MHQEKLEPPLWGHWVKKTTVPSTRETRTSILEPLCQQTTVPSTSAACSQEACHQHCILLCASIICQHPQVLDCLNVFRHSVSCSSGWPSDVSVDKDDLEIPILFLLLHRCLHYRMHQWATMLGFIQWWGWSTGFHAWEANTLSEWHLLLQILFECIEHRKSRITFLFLACLHSNNHFSPGEVWFLVMISRYFYFYGF